MPLRRARAGEPPHFSASEHNEFVDAATFVRDRIAASRLLATHDAPHAPPIKVKNLSGSNRTTGEVLTITDPIQDDKPWFTPIFEAISPANGSLANVCVLLEPCKAGAIAKAALVGWVWAKVNISSAAHTHAKPAASQAKMSSALAGFPIRWKPAGTGDKLCFIELTRSTLPRWGIASTTNALSATVSSAPLNQILEIGTGFTIPNTVIANGVNWAQFDTAAPAQCLCMFGAYMPPSYTDAVTCVLVLPITQNLSLVSDLHIDDLDFELRKLDIRGWSDGQPGAWIPWATGTMCPDNNLSVLDGGGATTPYDP